MLWVSCKIKKISSKKGLEVTFNSALSADLRAKPGKFIIKIECVDVHGNMTHKNFQMRCSEIDPGILNCKQK